MFKVPLSVILKNFQKFLCDHEVNSSVIGGYMIELKTQFCNRFQDFRRFGEVFSFLMKPDNMTI